MTDRKRRGTAKKKVKRRGRPNRAKKRDWKPEFLKALREEKAVSHACEKAGISRQTAYRHKREDAAFSEAWDEVYGHNVDCLEQAAFKRAVEGWLEPVFNEGEVCGHKPRFDNALLMFMLKCHRPEVYSGKDVPGGTFEDFAKAFAMFEAARGASRPSRPDDEAA